MPRFPIYHRDNSRFDRRFGRPDLTYEILGTIEGPEGSELVAGVDSGRIYLRVPVVDSMGDSRKVSLTPTEAIQAAEAGEHGLRWVPIGKGVTI